MRLPELVRKTHIADRRSYCEYFWLDYSQNVGLQDVGYPSGLRLSMHDGADPDKPRRASRWRAVVRAEHGNFVYYGFFTVYRSSIDVNNHWT